MSSEELTSLIFFLILKKIKVFWAIKKDAINLITSFIWLSGKALRLTAANYVL